MYKRQVLLVLLVLKVLLVLLVLKVIMDQMVVMVLKVLQVQMHHFHQELLLSGLEAQDLSHLVGLFVTDRTAHLI